MALPKMFKKFLVLCSGAIPAGITAHTIWRNKIADVQEKVILDDIPKIEEEEIVPEEPEEQQQEQKSEEGQSESSEAPSSQEESSQPEESSKEKEPSEEGEEDQEDEDIANEEEGATDENEAEEINSSEDDGIQTGTEGGLKPNEAIREIIKRVIEDGETWAKDPASLLSTYEITSTVTQMVQLLKKIQQEKGQSAPAEVAPAEVAPTSTEESK